MRAMFEMLLFQVLSSSLDSVERLYKSTVTAKYLFTFQPLKTNKKIGSSEEEIEGENVPLLQ